MILISHRGNLSGKDPDNENRPEQIYKVLNLGYHCEVDIWKKDGAFYLGHDEPQYKIDSNLLTNKNLWIHAKNLEALRSLPTSLRFFWHQTDDYTLTSDNFIWTFPNKIVVEKSIIVDNNKNWRSKDYDCYGVCSDYIL